MGVGPDLLGIRPATVLLVVSDALGQSVVAGGGQHLDVWLQVDSSLRAGCAKRQRHLVRVVDRRRCRDEATVAAELELGDEVVAFGFDDAGSRPVRMVEVGGELRDALLSLVERLYVRRAHRGAQPDHAEDDDNGDDSADDLRFVLHVFSSQRSKWQVLIIN